MKKFILQNQKGMSLVEVTVAAAISVMVAMGVMQINQNANKSLKTMTAKTDLGNFQDRIKSRLSKSENCIAAQVNGGNAFTGRDITNATTLNTGAFNSRGSGDDEFTFGQPIPTARDWKVDSVVINGFDNGSGTSVIGECDLTFNLTKVKNNAIYGSENKSFTIQMSCQVDNVSDNIVQSCASIIDADEEGHWIADGEGYIEFNGVTGDPRIRIGPASGGTITGSAVDAALTLDPITGQDSIEVASGDVKMNGGNINFLGTNGLMWGPSAGNNVTMIGNSAGTIDINGGGGFVRIISQTSGSDQSIRNLDGLYTDFIGPKGTDNYVSIGTPGSHTIYLSSTDITGTLVTNSDITAGGNVTADNYYYNSDERLKKDITSIENASDTISSLRGVNYVMRHEEFPDYNFSTELQYGLIAQEVEAIIPELVGTNPRTGFKSVKYGNIVPLLIEAFKEERAARLKLEKEVQEQKARNDEMNKLLINLQHRIEKLEKD